MEFSFPVHFRISAGSILYNVVFHVVIAIGKYLANILDV